MTEMIRKKAENFSLTTQIQHSTTNLANEMRQRKKNKGHTNCKGRSKTSFIHRGHNCLSCCCLVLICV